ncbi:recombinase family protein [Aquimarina celericrescens]|uniref:Recombinase family protein n=1 Tax=Aquimarina celericrescens TaxID=1964542 RepID=A0ABW5AYZ2_9FLAO|nr:recombinase family protein [Aquimarina celericrescens]
MNNIITYCRVSTEEQKKQGYSLAFQKEHLSSFAEKAEYNILKHYEEDYSAKTFDRSQWKKLKNYCDKYHTVIDKIVFTKWDRFSGNAKQAYEEIEWFEKREIGLNSDDNPLDLSLPESKIKLALYLTLSEIENDRLSRRVKEGLEKATKEGCWTGKSPYGYINYRLPNNKSTLIPDENARQVLDTFLLISTQNISIRKAWVQMRTKGMLISSSQFYKLIRNPVYIGKVILKSDENQTIEFIEGLHPPIIPTALFKKVQERLNSGSKNNTTKKGVKNHLYPLRGYIKCSQCDKVLTASASTGSNPNKKYHYYHCRDGCRERLSIKKPISFLINT